MQLVARAPGSVCLHSGLAFDTMPPCWGRLQNCMIRTKSSTGRYLLLKLKKKEKKATHKKFNRRLFIRTQKQSTHKRLNRRLFIGKKESNFWGNPLCQATKRRSNNS